MQQSIGCARGYYRVIFPCTIEKESFLCSYVHARVYTTFIAPPPCGYYSGAEVACMQMQDMHNDLLAFLQVGQTEMIEISSWQAKPSLVMMAKMR